MALVQGKIISRDVLQRSETIPLERIRVSGKNPRQSMDEEKLQNLMLDMAEKGLMQPILVRPVGPDLASTYEIVVGHRRLEAAKRLGWNEIRCTVQQMSDAEAYERMGLENIDREDLTPMEEAQWLKQAWENAQARGEKQEDFAKRLGKTQPWVSNKLRILKAPQDLLDLYTDGKISDKHILAVLPYKDYLIYNGLMAWIRNSINDGNAVSVSKVEGWLRHLIIVGSEQKYALRLEKFPYEFQRLPNFFDFSQCGGCQDVKMVEVAEGQPEPFCLNTVCWTDRIKAAREKHDTYSVTDEEHDQLVAEGLKCGDCRFIQKIGNGHTNLDNCTRDGSTCHRVNDPCYHFERGDGTQPQLENGTKSEERTEGRIQKCHVASCISDTVPGSIWCKDHQTSEQRRAARKGEDLPVNAVVQSDFLNKDLRLIIPCVHMQHSEVNGYDYCEHPDCHGGSYCRPDERVSGFKCPLGYPSHHWHLKEDEKRLSAESKIKSPSKYRWVCNCHPSRKKCHSWDATNDIDDVKKMIGHLFYDGIHYQLDRAVSQAHFEPQKRLCKCIAEGGDVMALLCELFSKDVIKTKPNQGEPKGSEIRYFHCDEKDRGVNRATIEEAMKELGCEECEGETECDGPEEAR